MNGNAGTNQGGQQSPGIDLDNPKAGAKTSFYLLQIDQDEAGQKIVPVKGLSIQQGNSTVILTAVHIGILKAMWGE